MLQGLLGRDTVSGIIDEYFLQQIPEILQKGCVVGNYLLQDKHISQIHDNPVDGMMLDTYIQLLHGLHETFRCSRRFGLRVIQFTPLEVPKVMLECNQKVRLDLDILRGRITTIPRHLVDLSDKMAIDAGPHDALHHG